MMFKLNKGDRLVMIGDSITDCGRNRPFGEGAGLGNGYPNLVNALLESHYPELSIRLINMGTSGNNVRDLKERWHTDVIDLKPDWLSIMIGINDVWRQYDRPLIVESHVYIKEYEQTLRELVDTALPQLKGLILMTPYYIEANLNDKMRNTMDQYSSVVEKIALEKKAVFVNTQAAFDGLLKEIYPAALAWDRVHPNSTGHMAIAQALLKEIGFEWDR